MSDEGSREQPFSYFGKVQGVPLGPAGPFRIVLTTSGKGGAAGYWIDLYPKEIFKGPYTIWDVIGHLALRMEQRANSEMRTEAEEYLRARG